MCDEKGQLLDGDQLMALVAHYWHKNNTLKGGGVVATQMSNLGLERFLQAKGLTLHRTKVGDRYVVEKMREGGFNVGGEQSGHIILTDYATTGDGLIAALQVLAVLVEDGRPASQAARQFTPLPQVLKNVRFSGGAPLDDVEVQKTIAHAEAMLAGTGRVLIRKSGTEPLIRVMAEGEDAQQVEAAVDSIAQSVEQSARRHG